MLVFILACSVQYFFVLSAEAVVSRGIDLIENSVYFGLQIDSALRLLIGFCISAHIVYYSHSCFLFRRSALSLIHI